MNLPQPISGVIPPMVTPLTAPDRLDIDAIERLVSYMLAGGAQAFFLLGTTGEGPSLTHPMRAELVERVCRSANEKVPVLVAITDTSREESIDLARSAANTGAAALVVSAPYYYPLEQTELAAYVERLARDLPLPFYLYNMPSHTKVGFAPETVSRLADLPNLYGIKDSSGDIEYFRRLCAAVNGRSDFALLMGPEELLAEAMRMGAHGGVCGGANLVPRLYTKLYEAARDGQRTEVDRLQESVLRIGRGVYGAGGYYLRGLKCALSLAGLCSDIVAEPFEPAGEAMRARVRETLIELELLPGVFSR